MKNIPLGFFIFSIFLVCFFDSISASSSQFSIEKIIEESKYDPNCYFCVLAAGYKVTTSSDHARISKKAGADFRKINPRSNTQLAYTLNRLEQYHSEISTILKHLEENSATSFQETEKHQNRIRILNEKIKKLVCHEHIFSKPHVQPEKPPAESSNTNPDLPESYQTMDSSVAAASAGIFEEKKSFQTAPSFSPRRNRKASSSSSFP
eukprot:Sdes_comp23620_c0_seq1m21813